MNHKVDNDDIKFPTTTTASKGMMTTTKLFVSSFAFIILLTLSFVQYNNMGLQQFIITITDDYESSKTIATVRKTKDKNISSFPSPPSPSPSLPPSSPPSPSPPPSSASSFSAVPVSSSSSLSCFRPNWNHTLSLLYNGDNNNNHHVVVPSKPIIHLGFPKVGTSSLYFFFQSKSCLGMRTSHWRCPPPDNNDTRAGPYCGVCMEKAAKDNLPVLQSCGNYDVHTQLDFASPSWNKYYLPQVELLQEFHNESPNATFILTFRSMDSWYKSLVHWGGMHKRLLKCNRTLLASAVIDKMNQTTLKEHIQQMFCNQVNRVRSFVKKHPSHTLIEIDIEDPNTANIMGRLFNVNGDQCWGQYNTKSNPVSFIGGNTT